MKKNVFFNFIVSYLLILFFSLSINLFAFTTYQNESRVQSDAYNQAILSQVRDSFDQRIINIRSIVDNITMDLSVRSLLVYTGSPTRYTRYATLEVINKLKSVTNVYSYVDSILLVYNDSSVFITDSSVYRSFEEFSLLSNYAYWREDQWNGLLSDVSYVKYAGAARGSEGPYTLIKPIQLGSANDSIGYIVINYHNDILKTHIGELIDLESGVMYVADSRGNMIMTAGNTALLDAINMKPGDLENGTLKENGHIAHTLISQSTSLRYVFLLPAVGFLDKPVNVLILALFGGVLVFGALFSYAMARRNAVPIRRIAEMITQQPGFAADTGGKGELEFIGNAMEAAIREHAEIKNEITRHVPILQSTMVSNILKGVYTLSVREDKELTALGIELPYAWYTVLIFDFQGAGNKKLLEYNWLNILLRNLIRDTVYAQGLVYFCDLDVGRIGCLFNADRGPCIDGGIQKGMEDLIRHMLQEHGAVLSIAMSRATQEPSDIPFLFKEAAVAVTHLLFSHPGRFARHGDVRLDTDIYTFSDEVENYLSISLRSGNVENVEKAIQKALDDMEAERMSPEYSKYYFIDLAKILHKTASAIGVNIIDLYRERQNFNPIEAIMQSKNLWVTRDLVYNLYMDTAAAICDRLASVSVPLIESMKAYIRESYANADFSLQMLATRFNMHPSYVSGFFKKSAGENFVNYLNSLRLEHARKLLDDTELQVGEISERVGYNNSSVFISNFKKAYGVTPGAYRNLSS